jgi:hypothetical protein
MSSFWRRKDTWWYCFLVCNAIVLGVVSGGSMIYSLYYGDYLPSLIMGFMLCVAVEALILHTKVFKQIRFEVWLQVWRFRSERALHGQYIRFNKHKRAVKVTIDQWERLCADYGFICLACGRTEPKIKLSIDHIIPLSKGGWHQIDNLQPLCLGCNSHKGATHRDYRKDWIV